MTTSTQGDYATDSTNSISSTTCDTPVYYYGSSGPSISPTHEELYGEKPKFDRVMKMRNTGRELFKPMVWKPIRG